MTSQKAVLRTLVSVMILCCSSGCGVFDDALARVDKMQASIDQALQQMQQASGDWQQQSKDWQSTFKQVQQNFAAANEKLLGDTLKNTADTVIAHTSAESRADIDYLQTKLLDNLKLVAQAVRKAREQLMEAKKRGDKNSIQAILDGIASVKVFDDPTIVSFTPNHFDVHCFWPKEDRLALGIVSGTRIEAGGWGFDRPGGELLRTEVRIVGGDGKERALPGVPVSHTTNYLVQFTVDASANGFAVGDRQVILICGNERRELPINWTAAPEKQYVDASVTESVWVPKSVLVFWDHEHTGMVYEVSTSKSLVHSRETDKNQNEYIRDCCVGVFDTTGWRNLNNMPPLNIDLGADHGKKYSAIRQHACVRDQGIPDDPRKHGLAYVDPNWAHIMDDELWFIVEGEHYEQRTRNEHRFIEQKLN